MKQNFPKQTHLHISAPNNLQYEPRGLITGKITSIKQYGKNGNKKEYNEKCLCCFFTI